MKALTSLVVALAVLAVSIVPSSAASDKLLQNLFGTVSYQQGTGAQQPVGVNASVALNDSDTAITGANSQAVIQLPDSSRVLVGQNSTVQLKAFDNASGIATATFFVVGKVRFRVEHPSGAKANYTFQTSTGQIAVRGTEGDISITGTQMQVNCYELTDPNNPVEVDLNNGKKYFLKAGDALVVGIAGAAIASAATSSVTQTLHQPFHEFDNATSQSALTGTAAGAAGVAAASAVAPAAIAAGAAAAVAVGVLASNHGGATSNPSPPPPPPTPTPTPHPTPGPVVLTPSSVSFTGLGQSTTVTATETDFHGSFAISGGAASIATATQTGKDTFQITSAGSGTTSFAITGDKNVSPATLPVHVASGQVTINPTSMTFNKNSSAKNVTVSEPGYTGPFSFTGGSSSVAAVSGGGNGPSATFQVSAVGGGSTSFTFGDKNGNSSSPLSVTVAPGITLDKTTVTLTVGGAAMNVTATESEPLTVMLSGSIDKPKVATISPSSGSTGSPAVFKVTPVAFGNATLTVVDQYGNSSNASIVVNSPSPSPAPSTTCVPIIIHEKHHPMGAATPCPTPTPGPVVRRAPSPAPGHSMAPPPHWHPHPIGNLPQTPAPPGKPEKPGPRTTPSGPHPAAPHPAGPAQGGLPGAMTPPPMPGPPG